MSRKRNHYSADFKAKIALAALQNTLTTSELAARHGLHPTQINQWKRQALDNMGTLFERGSDTEAQAAGAVDELHRVIGQLTVERDFLSINLGQ